MPNFSKMWISALYLSPHPPPTPKFPPHPPQLTFPRPNLIHLWGIKRKASQMNAKRKRTSDADILKVFRDLGIETEEARERFRRMGKAQTLDVWGNNEVE